MSVRRDARWSGRLVVTQGGRRHTILLPSSPAATIRRRVPPASVDVTYRVWADTETRVWAGGSPRVWADAATGAVLYTDDTPVLYSDDTPVEYA